MKTFDEWWAEQVIDDFDYERLSFEDIARSAWDAASDKAADAVSARMDVISAMMEKQAGTQEGATLRSMWMNLSAVLGSIKEMKND